MPVTITAGVTFSGGGLTMAFAPPSVPTTSAAWVGGGFDWGPVSATNIVNKITYATDTATASVKGPLSEARYWLTGAGTTTYGWYGGGSTPSGNSSTIDRITYASDTGTASIRGPLNYAESGAGAVTDYSTYGWWGGGSQPLPTLGATNIARIVYATDTATATSRGTLSAVRYQLATTCTSEYGWFAGGRGGPFSSVDRMTYSSDTSTASTRGPLNSTVIRFAAAGTGSYGWYAAGQTGPLSTVQRIDYANDTTTASIRGPLSLARYGIGASSDGSTYNWYIGGYASSAQNVIDRVTLATDTATATVRGPLSSSRAYLATASGT